MLAEFAIGVEKLILPASHVPPILPHGKLQQSPVVAYWIMSRRYSHSMAAFTSLDGIHASLSSSYRLVGVGIVLIILVLTVYGALYRLFFSPIAHIPGPLFARLTFWNEFYYDVVLGGKYGSKLKGYHARYGKKLYVSDIASFADCKKGPVVRINPYEVHIMDSDFYEELYVNASKGKSKVDKWHWAVGIST